MKSLVTFKRLGKVIVSCLPPNFLMNYTKSCPICVAMNKRRKSLPKGPNSAYELDYLVPWEEVFTDSSGKFRRKSKQGTTTSHTSQRLYVLRQIIKLPVPPREGFYVFMPIGD